jgi:hypothetical protein
MLLLRARHEPTAPHLVWVASALVAMGLMDGIHSLTPVGPACSWTRHAAAFAGGMQKPVDFEQFRQTISEIGLFWLVINVPLPPGAFSGGAAPSECA